MTLTLFELAGEGERRFSPYCWRIRMALAHKGLEADVVPVRFTEKHKIAFSGQERVPVLVDEDTVIHDSWAIANYLEEAYPDRPSLFGDPAGRRLCRFLNLWADQTLHPKVSPLILLDIFRHIDSEDRDYFRSSRETRLGKRLEDVMGDRDQRLGELRTTLMPVRSLLAEQPFVAGDSPAYADYIVFGAFQWARCCSDIGLLEADDPVCDWRGRVLALFDGLASQAPGYPC